MCIMTNKAKFIQGVNEGTIVLKNKNKDEIVAMLRQQKFFENFQVNKSDDEEMSEDVEVTKDVVRDSIDRYLLSMPLYSLSKERVQDLEKKINDKGHEIEELEKLSVEDLWSRELDKFEKAYIAELKERD